MPKGKYVRIEEIKKKIVNNLPKNMNGLNNGFFGKHHSEETKNKTME